jgi:hypothetical protein
MKTSKSYFLFLIIFSILQSCNNFNESDINIDLPNSLDIKGETIHLNTKLLNPSGMCESDDKLLIFDNVKTGLIKVYNLPDLTFNFSWGNKGKGPDEFMNINSDYFRTFNNKLELLDNGILKRLDLLDNTLITNSILRLPIMENPINRLQKINDSVYFADNIFTDGGNEHIIMNIKKRIIIDKFGKYPKESSRIKENVQKFQVYRKSNISNPVLGKFVVFYTYFGRIKMYDANGKLIKSIIMDDKEIEMVSLEKREQNKTYFALPYATNNYFYVLRINKNDDEIAKDINNFKPELLIWDWNGNLISRYKLDKPVTQYAISEKHQKLYGTFVLKDDELYVFDLPNL